VSIAPLNGLDLRDLRERLAAAPEAADLRPLGLGRLDIGPGALDRLPDIVGELRHGEIALIADARPMQGRDGEIKRWISTTLNPRRVTLGDEHGTVRADSATLNQATPACADAGLILSVGSGTIVDIAKVVSTRLGLPHVAVQTAGSVNGFSDDQSVLLVDGVKRTVQSRWPERLVIDIDVIQRAPAALNRAGLGDLLATYTAPADWRLAKLVGQDDSYSPFAVSLARGHVDRMLEEADGVHRGDPAAIETLTAALVLSGIAMGVAGRTAPCSGMEHTVSHLLEMRGTDALHGAQVGALTVLSALLWARVRGVARAGGLRALRFPTEAEMEPRVREAFVGIDPSGSAAEECWRGYQRKLARWNDAHDDLDTLWQRWPAFDLELDALLVSPERLVAALRNARAPVRLTQLGIRDTTARWALAHCHLMRDRFTVADLAFFMGVWEPSDVDALLGAAARLGAGL
jgi:glycerol-1-phosphate dehydrogenase [NAD(P)+]